MVCGSLFIAACATYTEPDATGQTPDPTGSDAGDNQGGSADTDSGGSGGSQTGGQAGKGGSTSTAGKTNGGSGGAAAGGASGGGMGGAAEPTGGTATGGTGGAVSGGAAGSSGAGGAGGAAGTGGGGAGGTSGASGTSGTAGSGGSGGGTVNLVTNSGFEMNTTGWSVFGGSASIQTSVDQAHGGTRSLLITGRTQTYQGPQYNVLSVITPGASYRLRLWGRLAASSPTGSLMATARYTCSGGSSAGDNFMQWVGATAAAASSWTELTAVKTFPTCADGSMTGAWIYVESPTATLSYYIDDVVLAAE